MKILDPTSILYINMTMFEFYSEINKPFLSPPSSVFRIVWPILYILMTASLTLVLLSKKSNEKNIAIILFIIQLIINLSWTKIFFIDRDFETAFLTCLLLTIIFSMGKQDFRYLNFQCFLLYLFFY